MSRLSQINQWVKDNLPVLSKVYDNKLVKMIYDRFATLPYQTQRIALLCMIFVVVGVFVYFVFSRYISLFSQSYKISKSEKTKKILTQYQKEKQAKGMKLKKLEDASRMAQSGFSQYLIGLGRNVGIAPLMIKGSDKGKEGSYIVAQVNIEKLNLNQLKNYLYNVEHGEYSIEISKLQIDRDRELKGYLSLEMQARILVMSNQ